MAESGEQREPGPGFRFDFARIPVHAAPADGVGVAAGQPDAREIVASMESAFGRSFAGVRIRADAAAASRAAALSALAYNDGNEIGFAEGVYNPRTAEGLRTIAHEFAHVAQRRGSGRAGGRSSVLKRSVTEDPDAVEREAENAADQVVAGAMPDLGEIATTSVLLQAKTPTPRQAATKLPPLGPGQFFTYSDKGSRFYIFRLEDALSWGPRLRRETLLRYFADNFDLHAIADREAFVDEFTLQEQVQYVTVGATPSPPPKAGEPTCQLYHSVEVSADVHARALLWVRLRHPEVTPKHLEEKGAAPLPRSGDEMAGKSGFEQRRFEPRGELRLDPRPVRGADDIPAYVAYSDLTSTSAVTASVHFDESDPDLNTLNYYPNLADFDWKLTRGGKTVDTGPLVKHGEISRKLKLPDPGLYTLHVTVSSQYFAGGRKLELSEYMWALPERQRSEDVFNQKLVGDDPGQPFTRASDGTLKVKEGQPKASVQDDILELIAMIAAIERLQRDGKLGADEAKPQLDLLRDKLASLEKVKTEVGIDAAGAYLVQGTFVSREDSSVTRISAVMQRTARTNAAGTATYSVTLYDFTLSVTDPVRHVGEASAQVRDRPETEVFAELERSALQAMANDWHNHNDYGYGTVLLGVELLEKPGSVVQLPIDTYNVLRTGAKVGSAVATAGAVVLIGFSAFSGGATAPIGIVILEGVTVASGAAVAVYNINERIQKDTFKPDASLVLDLLAFVPALGPVTKLIPAMKPLLNGMLYVSLGATAVAMTLATRQELLDVEARYNAAREPIEHDLERAAAAGGTKDADALRKRLEDLKNRHDVMVAQVIGSAAVSGGLLLVQLGASATQAAWKGTTAPIERERSGSLTSTEPVKPPDQAPEVTEPAKDDQAQAAGKSTGDLAVGTQDVGSEEAKAVLRERERIEFKVRELSDLLDKSRQESRAAQTRILEINSEFTRRGVSTSRLRDPHYVERLSPELKKLADEWAKLFEETDKGIRERKALGQRWETWQRAAGSDVVLRRYAELRGRTPDSYARTRAAAAHEDILGVPNTADNPTRPDHVVPVIEIIAMDDFVLLPDDIALEILNDPENIEMLNESANSSKSDWSWEEWPQWEEHATPEVRTRMIKRENELRGKILDRIHLEVTRLVGAR